MTLRALFWLIVAAFVGILGGIHLNETRRCEAIADSMGVAWRYVLVDGCQTQDARGQWVSAWVAREAGKQ